MKILIVEDEPKTGDYLKQGLVEAGFNVDLVRDGMDGLHFGMTEAYDLIVLDVMLPGLDGWRVLQALRKAGKEMPVLFLTAKDSVAQAERQRQATKPGPVLLRTFSPTRAWRPAVIERLSSLLCVSEASFCSYAHVCDLGRWQSQFKASISRRLLVCLRDALRAKDRSSNALSGLGRAWFYPFQCNTQQPDFIVLGWLWRYPAPTHRHIREASPHAQRAAPIPPAEDA